MVRTERNAMRHSLLFLILLLTPSTVMALETMTPSEMTEVVALKSMAAPQDDGGEPTEIPRECDPGQGELCSPGGGLTPIYECKQAILPGGIPFGCRNSGAACRPEISAPTLRGDVCIPSPVPTDQCALWTVAVECVEVQTKACEGFIFCTCELDGGMHFDGTKQVCQ